MEAFHRHEEAPRDGVEVWANNVVTIDLEALVTPVAAAISMLSAIDDHRIQTLKVRQRQQKQAPLLQMSSQRQQKPTQLQQKPPQVQQKQQRADQLLDVHRQMNQTRIGAL